MDDKRKFSREQKNMKSEVHSDEGMTFSNSADISKGGIFISTPEPLRQGTELTLSLYIKDHEQIDLKGIVRWVRADETETERAGMGIEFVDQSDEALRKLFPKT